MTMSYTTKTTLIAILSGNNIEALANTHKYMYGYDVDMLDETLGMDKMSAIHK